MDDHMQVNVTLTVNLYFRCPYCSTINELIATEADEEGQYSKKIFNNKWDELKGMSVCCEHCRSINYIKNVIW